MSASTREVYCKRDKGSHEVFWSEDDIRLRVEDRDRVWLGDWQKTGKIKPLSYSCEQGATTLFLYDNPELNSFTLKINLQIEQNKIDDWRHDWRYVPHNKPHVTAASIINPKKHHRILRSPNWPTNRDRVRELVGNLRESLNSELTFTFYRLLLSPNGGVLLVGYPNLGDEVGRFRLEMYNHFGEEKTWWNAAAMPVVGHFEPLSATNQSTFAFPFDRVQQLLQSVSQGFQERTIAVECLWVIVYTNRFIDPRDHVIYDEPFPLP